MFSDFAYLDRAMFLTAVFPILLHRIFRADKSKAAAMSSLKRVELKTVAVFLMMISLVLMVVYDWIATTIKYRQGFYVDPVSGYILTRPREKYDEADKKLFPSIAVLMNLSWTMKAVALFLVMALWNHMSKAVLNKQFMSSAEFKAYAVYSVISLSAYPFLQIWYYISKNIVVSTVAPLFVHVFQCFLLMILTQVASRRLRFLSESLPPRSSAISRITYYANMNNYLSFAIFLEFVGLGAISIDIVTANMFYYNKFLLDIFTKVFNLGFCASYVLTILILCPAINSPAPSAAVSPLTPGSPVKLRASQNLPALERQQRKTSTTSDIDKNKVVLHRDTRGYFKLKVDTHCPDASRRGTKVSSDEASIAHLSIAPSSAGTHSSHSGDLTDTTADTYADEIASEYAN